MTLFLNPGSLLFYVPVQIFVVHEFLYINPPTPHPPRHTETPLNNTASSLDFLMLILWLTPLQVSLSASRSVMVIDGSKFRVLTLVSHMKVYDTGCD
jgi:hypothetical protein